jgi:hypothetical protein
VNAETTEVTRGRQIGRQSTRAVIAGFVALLLLGATLRATEAQQRPYHSNISRKSFVGLCVEAGGTTKSAGANSVKCTLGNGYVITCNFKSHSCQDKPPTIQNPDADDVPPGGGVLDPGQLTGNPGPQIGTADTGGGGVLAPDDDQSRPSRG